MKRGAKIGLAAGGAAALAGGVYLLGKGSFGQGLSSIGSTLSPCSGTITGGLTATLNPNYAAQTAVGGPAPGPAGQHEYPCLWNIAPQTLPASGYQGGPAITRQKGYVWVVLAINMAVTGTMTNGQPASGNGPWVGIVEYYNGTLIRVYPQRAGYQGLTSLGQWSGGYA